MGYGTRGRAQKLFSDAGRLSSQQWCIASEPVWTADGKELLVRVTDNRNRLQRLLGLQGAEATLKPVRQIEIPWEAGAIYCHQAGGEIMFSIKDRGVWSIRPGDTRPCRLISEGLNPIHTADGNVLFLRGGSDGLNLYLFKRATGISRKLTQRSLIRSFAPSPSGGYVAVAYVPQATSENISPGQVLAIVPTSEDSGLTQIATAAHLDYGMAWSSDSTLTFARVNKVEVPSSRYEFGIFDFDLNTKVEVVRLQYGKVPAPAGRASWSIDGKYLSYSSTTVGPDGFLVCSPRDFLRVNTETGEVTRLVFPGDVKASVLSPDGKLLVSTSAETPTQLLVGEWSSGRIQVADVGAILAKE